MKKLFLVLVLVIVIDNLKGQVNNTSYITQNGEKVLQLSIIVPLNISETWKLFTTNEGLKKWIAPIAEIDMRTGGSIKTNYDPNKSVNDSTSIKLGIINYLENEMLTLKVNLNDNFPPEVKKQDNNLQEILQFIKMENGNTKIISSMVGWGKGTQWDKTYSFFEKGNDWTFKGILKLF